MGHQVCAPAPTVALAGLAAELLNNGMAVYEMGPAATTLDLDALLDDVVCSFEQNPVRP